MKRNRTKKEKVENEVVPNEKKSKFTLYWEKKPTEGTIVNMRAVMR